LKQHMYADAMSLTENYSLWSQDTSDITAAALHRVYAADNHLSALQVGLQEVVRLAGARHGVLVIHYHQGDDVYPLFSAGGRLVCAYAFDGPDAPLLGGATSPWSAADISDWSSMPVHILLKSFDNVVGAIHLDRVDYPGPMAEEKRVAVEMLARQLAFIVENSELLRIAKEEQTLLDMLTAAVQISQRLNVGLDAEQPLAEFLESCRFLLDAERCSILVLDRERETLRLLADDGLDPSDDKDRPEVGLHDSIAGWVARTGESVFISNVQSDSGHNKTVDAATGFETRQLVCVPLSVRGKVLGVIQAVNKINGNFDRLDLGLLQVLALNVATAMENTKRYARQQAEVEQATELYSVASHGLRSPLMSILTSVEWILETGVQDEAHKARLEDIRSQTFSLSQFASEILDLSRVEMGNVRVKLTPVAIVPLIKRVLAAFELRVPTHHFEMQVEGTIPPARADESQLPIVLDHLLENAVKYSPAGSVVRVKVVASNEHVMISVLDEGQGIPTDELETVFSRFYRGRKQTSKGHSLGLGLYIARKLVQAQDGNIWAQSEMGQGACFTFTLPREEEIGG
jgi:signal transduction histidine kinase